METEASAEYAPAVGRLRRQVRVCRGLGWLLLGAAGLVLWACIPRMIADPRQSWTVYLVTLALVLVWYHAMPGLLTRWLVKHVAEVRAEGDGWTIGQYSEATVRRVLEQATARVPERLDRIRLIVVDEPSTNAWTWTSLLWPGWKRHHHIRVTSGALHYLESDELQALLLHELAHNLPQHRLLPYGTLVWVDVALQTLAYSCFVATSSAALAYVAFFGSRYVVWFLASQDHAPVRAVEHLCDLYSGDRFSTVALINALLKMGEEAELTEAIVVWVAREMMYSKYLDEDDLRLAFQAARPYGRIFHESIFRHATETVRELSQPGGPASGKNAEGRTKNPLLAQLIADRRGRRMQRIRWRHFDRDGKGCLSADEVAALCRALREQPDRVLVTSREEQCPTSHPPVRARILLLWACRPPCAAASN